MCYISQSSSCLFAAFKARRLNSLDLSLCSIPSNAHSDSADAKQL